MARRYYRPRRTVTVRPKKKWASNVDIKQFQVIPTSGTANERIPYVTVVANSTPGSTPTPTILKCGNFKVAADCYATSSTAVGIVHLVAVVMYKPEGIGLENFEQLGNYFKAHPEYVMAWRQLDSVRAADGAVDLNMERVSFSSRLKRNLNSGDQIIFGIVCQPTSGNVSVRVSATIQYWTCAN